MLVLRFDHDCEFRRYIPYDKTVQTLPLRGWIDVLDPEVIDRGAREDCTEDCPARVGGDYANQRVADPSEGFLREYPQVLQ
jgi:hypothetical protein